jgi:hypothetical protein
LEKFVIAGPTDDGIRLYWSNEDGWVDRYSATTFDDESVNDPIGASDRVYEGEPICDLCGFPPECGKDDCWVCAGNWNGETGNHFGCEATEEYNGN